MEEKKREEEEEAHVSLDGQAVLRGNGTEHVPASTIDKGL